jgi:hypothetical protein
MGNSFPNSCPNWCPTYIYLKDNFIVIPNVDTGPVKELVLIY